MTILNSAAKIVFLMLTLTACLALFRGILDAKDFMVLASMAFGFYFAAPSGQHDGLAGK